MVQVAVALQLLDSRLEARLLRVGVQLAQVIRDQLQARSDSRHFLVPEVVLAPEACTQLIVLLQQRQQRELELVHVHNWRHVEQHRLSDVTGVECLVQELVLDRR